MTAIIEVRHLVKRYRQLTAVDDVSFACAPGICFGLLGPNGAGKTTTIEIIEGVTAADAGEVRYRDQPRDARFHQEVGIMFQQTALLDFLTVGETLETFAALYRQPADLAHLIERCRLDEILGQMNQRVSGGQRQRLLLALALVNRPRLVFLDEPSTGLDPQARKDLWDIIEAIKAEGSTLILTTHYMEEAQRLCDEVAIMDHGRIIAQGTPQALIERHCSGVTIGLPAHRLEAVGTPTPWPVHRVRDRIEIRTEDARGVLAELMRRHVDLTDMTVRSPTLENVFLKLTGRKLAE
ncbi:MAG: ABC transporter ATP-binding protein [Desulfobacteraceae bacterium]|jgi:ABC-2 type transport system ATP-binding protein|nr:ABC transporter ATP-binding protein [Desulfobacteraceae bacterium]